MENQPIPFEEKGEIVLYQPDDNVRLEVRLQDETVWLTQQQMAELFSTTGTGGRVPGTGGRVPVSQKN
jgi:hypothetical protein